MPEGTQIKALPSDFGVLKRKLWQSFNDNFFLNFLLKILPLQWIECTYQQPNWCLSNWKQIFRVGKFIPQFFFYFIQENDNERDENFPLYDLLLTAKINFVHFIKGLLQHLFLIRLLLASVTEVITKLENFKTIWADHTFQWALLFAEFSKPPLFITCSFISSIQLSFRRLEFRKGVQRSSRFLQFIHNLRGGKS